MRRLKHSGPQTTGRRRARLIAALVLATFSACGDQDQVRDPASHVAAVSVRDRMLVIANRASHGSVRVFVGEPAAACNPGLMVPRATRAPARRVDAAFLLARLPKLPRAGLGGKGAAGGKDRSVSAPGLLPENCNTPGGHRPF